MRPPETPSLLFSEPLQQKSHLRSGRTWRSSRSEVRPLPALVPLKAKAQDNLQRYYCGFKVTVSSYGVQLSESPVDFTTTT